ncbi:MULTISPECIES: hypothetical protein [unclassified Carboxylicivirga]|uniref:hypothetical protein n=1 Tax=Carboxylicivirga TaxID=1628153 RepID=UPI003D3386C4
MNSPLKIASHNHPAAFLLEQWQLFLNGLDRVILFYRINNVEPGYEAMEWNRQLQQAMVPMTVGEELAARLDEIIAERKPHQWLRPEHLPFVQQATLSIAQLDLFSESQYLVLLVKSQVSHLAILSYLFFRNDCSNFGISDGRSQLETSHKAIIGKMASQFASISLNTFERNTTAEKTFREQTRELLSARQMVTQNSQNEFTDWKSQWLDSYLNKQSERDGVNYVISKNTQAKILNSPGSYRQIEQALDKAVDYICKLFPATPGDTISLDEAYLILPSDTSQSSDHTTANQQPQTRQSKTMQLLDRLENAANALQQRGQAITSADVGAAMAKPISAPAISDALRKNKIRILQLLEQYPQRWTTIRQSFKPIINLSVKRDDYLSASG